MVSSSIFNDSTIPLTTRNKLRQVVSGLEGQLQRRDGLRKVILQATHDLNENLELEPTLQSILDRVREILEVVGCAVWLGEENDRTMTCRLANGLGADAITGWKMESDTGLAGWVFRNNQPLLVNDAAEDARHFEGVNSVTRLGIRALITVPLRARGRTIGVLQVVDDKVGRFSLEDLEIMEGLAIPAALAIDNARLFSNLEEQLREKRQIEEALLEANSAKNRLFSIMAHDIKNPFTSILHFSEIIRGDLDILEDDQLKALADEMYGTVCDLNTLLDSLLLWSRSQMEGITCIPETFPLGAMVERTIGLLGKNADKKEIHLVNNVPPDTLISTDPNLVETVLRNLLANAIKFTPRGGRVITDVGSRDGHTTISVIDSGIGMSAEQIRNLFTGYPASSQGTEAEPGTGLGLALCNELARHCGGRLEVESVPEKGSIFRFLFPERP